ncbi:hypothetical protein [Nonomuraea cavernae]|uniref:Uncharacterized protein n=1 Tax=Nonomuraea cavernae TaxID=2045107 RepID=A0A917ZHL8_9ACTN|nr:hypothetical protein [Nonomuraea cavernae]GGO83480.1 hypothetical protein GCM10012289_77030 [Nonomuraea cavernae]
MHISYTTARRALAAAREHGLDIPAAVDDAERAAAVIRNIGHTPDSPSVPADPQAMRQALAEHADAIQHARATGRAAADLSRHVQPMVVRTIADAAPAWVDELAGRFADSRDALADALDDIPPGVDDTMLHRIPAAVFASWQRAAGHARQLDDLTAARNTIASAAGEQGTRDRDLWAAVELPPVGDGRAFTFQHAPALRQWRENRRQPVTKWRAVLDHEPFTISLALVGQVEQRVTLWQQWSDAAQRRHQRIFSRA